MALTQEQADAINLAKATIEALRAKQELEKADCMTVCDALMAQINTRSVARDAELRVIQDNIDAQQTLIDAYAQYV